MAKRVVIADDEPLAARQMRFELERGGYEVIGVARTGTEAVDMCVLHHPDFVLMDIKMPDMDGFVATGRIMSQCPTPVVIVTGDPGRVEGAEEAGAVGYVVKPLTLEKFSAVVKSARERFTRMMSGEAEGGGGQQEGEGQGG